MLPFQKNSTCFDKSNFFIHCESNGISSRVNHQRCISSTVGCIFFRNDDIQDFVLMICNFFEIDDIHGFAVILGNERKRGDSTR